MHFPHTVNTKVVVGLLIISVILTSGFIYVFAAPPSSTFWVAPGIYPGAPTYTFWREGNNYFAKDANGEIEYSGTNANNLIETVATNNSHVAFAEGTYLITEANGIQLWNVHNLTLTGLGHVVLMKQEESGYVGQIMEIMRSSTNIRIDGITFDQNRDNPNHLTNPALGQQWNIRMGNGSEYLYFENCQFVNGAQNNLVTGNGAHYYFENCLFDNAGEHIVYISAAVPAGTALIDCRFTNCVFQNWGEEWRGWVNIGQSYTTFSNCYFEPDANGNGINSSSYTVVVGPIRNQTLFENCIFVDPFNGIYVRGNSTRWVNCEFINVSLGAGAMAFRGAGNQTVVQGCDFYNWGYRVFDVGNANNWLIEGCWFSGSVTSSIIAMGTRFAIIGNIFDTLTNYGAYGINDATGSGVFIGNNVCNGTFTFNYPADLIIGDNIWDV